MYPKILLLGFVLMVLVLGSAGAATTVLNITAPSYNSMPASGTTSLNYSDTIILYIKDANNLILGSLVITAPPVRTVTQNVIVNHTVTVSNTVDVYPKGNGTITLESCGSSNTITVNNVTVQANSPPCLNINVSSTLSPNSLSYSYSNSSYGNHVNVSIKSNFSINRHFNLSIGDVYSTGVPYNLTIGTFSANSILSNRSAMDSLASALASQGCAPGGLVNFWDNVTQRNMTVCTKFSNKTWANPFMLMLPFSNITNRSVTGIGQGFAQALSLVNQSNNQCHVQLRYQSNQTTFWHQNATTCQTNYNQKLQEDASGSSVLTIVAVAVIAVIVCGTMVGLTLLYVRKKRVDAREGRK